jgi:hypothetical protein
MVSEKLVLLNLVNVLVNSVNYFFQMPNLLPLIPASYQGMFG